MITAAESSSANAFATLIGQGIVGLIVILGLVGNHLKGNGREKKRKDEVDVLKDVLRQTIQTEVQAAGLEITKDVGGRITRLEVRIDKRLEGMEEAQRTLDGRVDDIEKREREDLEKKLEEGRISRRSST